MKTIFVWSLEIFIKSVITHEFFSKSSKDFYINQLPLGVAELPPGVARLPPGVADLYKNLYWT